MAFLVNKGNGDMLGLLSISYLREEPYSQPHIGQVQAASLVPPGKHKPVSIIQAGPVSGKKK